MSVLACGRRDCENIMCDRTILYGTAHLCNSCYAELVEWRQTWPAEMTAAQVRSHIDSFLRTPVGSQKVLTQEGIDEEFHRLVGDD